MTFGEGLRTILVNAAGVTAIVGGRIFPVRLPPDVTIPAVRYSVVSDIPTNSFDGSNGNLRKGRIQIDCFAAKYLDVQALADAVAGALQAVTTPGFTSMQLSRRDSYEEETRLFVVSTDFSMWMTEN